MSATIDRSGWKRVRLEAFGKVLRGVSFDGQTDLLHDKSAQSIAIFRSNNIQQSTIDYSDLIYVRKSKVNRCQLMQNNDILICMANGSKALVGKSALFINVNQEFSFGAFMGIFRCNRTSMAPFVAYLLQSNHYREYIDVLLSGSSINNLRPSDIESLEFSIPPPSEQLKIARVLKSVDDHIVALQSLIAKYDAIKKATVNLSLKPKTGWNKIRLGDFEPHRNNTCARSLTSSSTGKVRNIHYGDILVKYGELVSLKFDQVDYLSEEGEANSPNDYLQDGDIVIADTAEDETAGKVVEIQDVADRKAVAGLHTVFLRPPTDLFARGWLGYWMNSRFYHDQLLPYLTGIKVLSLAKSSLANTEIYYPSRTEQERLVRTLESIDTHLVALHTQADKARKLKTGMMSYFFG